MARETWRVSVYKEGLIEIDTDEMTIEQAVEDWLFDLDVDYDLIEREQDPIFGVGHVYII